MVDVTLALAGEMLALGGAAETPEAGRLLAAEALADGRALARFRAVVEAQGGDVSVLDDPAVLMGQPVATVTADADGVVADLDALALGYAAVALGAGRATKEDAVDAGAGFVLNKRPGEPVRAGEPLAFVYASDPSRADAEAVRQSFVIADAAPAPRPLLLDRYDGTAWAGPSWPGRA